MKIIGHKHRLGRDTYRGFLYAAFTLCVARKKPIFAAERVVAECVPLLAAASEANRAKIVVYTFMPDHLHILLEGDSMESDLWCAVVDFKQRSGFKVLRTMGAKWQKGFFDRILREDDDLKAQVRYILMNPVRKGLVADWSEYGFSGSLRYELKDMTG